MGPNLRKAEFAEAAMLGLSWSQASIADSKKFQYGHRALLRARFLRGGGRAVADFESSELIISRQSQAAVNEL
ncbi:MAG: hypothetical protein N2B02_02740 [Amylibacter sp.]